MNCVIHEALRFGPPASTNTSYCLERDTKIAGMRIKGGTTFVVNIYGLHRSGSQWQRPYEFLPDRFDNSHPLALTPSGTKRHPMSFFAFNGGRRVCFGKTFAEMVLKVTSSLISQSFDMSFVETDRYSKNCLPQLFFD